jgi:hypothetical protein
MLYVRNPILLGPYLVLDDMCGDVWRDARRAYFKGKVNPGQSTYDLEALLFTSC